MAPIVRSESKVEVKNSCNSCCFPRKKKHHHHDSIEYAKKHNTEKKTNDVSKVIPGL